MEYGNAKWSSLHAASSTVPQGDQRERNDLPRNILANVPSVSNETMQGNRGTSNVLSNTSEVDYENVWRLPGAWIRPFAGSRRRFGSWPALGFGLQSPGAGGGQVLNPWRPILRRRATPQQPSFPYGGGHNAAASVDHIAPYHRGRDQYSNKAPNHDGESPYQVTPVRGQRPLRPLPDHRQHAPDNKISASASSHRKVAAGRDTKSVPTLDEAGDDPGASSARCEATTDSVAEVSGTGDAPTAAAKRRITVRDSTEQPPGDFDPSDSTLAPKDSDGVPKECLCASYSSTRVDRSCDRQVLNDCSVENAKCEGEDDVCISLEMGCYEEAAAFDSAPDCPVEKIYRQWDGISLEMGCYEEPTISYSAPGRRVKKMNRHWDCISLEMSCYDEPTISNSVPRQLHEDDEGYLVISSDDDML